MTQSLVRKNIYQKVWVETWPGNNDVFENLKPFEFLALVIRNTLIVSFRLFPFSHMDAILKRRRRKYFENWTLKH